MMAYKKEILEDNLDVQVAHLKRDVISKIFHITLEYNK